MNFAILSVRSNARLTPRPPALPTSTVIKGESGQNAWPCDLHWSPSTRGRLQRRRRRNKPAHAACRDVQRGTGRVCVATRWLGGQRRRTAAVRFVDGERLGDRQPESGDQSAVDQLGWPQRRLLRLQRQVGCDRWPGVDAFVDQSTTGATDTFNTMAGELPGGQSVDLPGVDAAQLNPNVDGKYGVIMVPIGRFSYSISLPTSSGAQTQLETLASFVLTRAQQYK